MKNIGLMESVDSSIIIERLSIFVDQTATPFFTCVNEIAHFGILALAYPQHLHVFL